MRFAILAMAGLILAACAGRPPQPVATVTEADRYLTCQQIVAEVQINNDRISELGAEEGAKVAQNVVAGVAGLFIPVLWLGMDYQDAAGKEGQALSQRNRYLSGLAEARCAKP
jgi:hypothetical protein